MKPTVGRIVHYNTRGSADGKFPPTAFAAIITEVCSPDCVSLVTFGPSGIRFEPHVPYGYGVGQWNWPPQEAGKAGDGQQFKPGSVTVPYYPPQPQQFIGRVQGSFPGQTTPAYCGPSGGNTNTTSR